MSDTQKFLALATDYDGTIARHGEVAETTYQALLRWKETGRKLLLVTGREIPDLYNVFAHNDVFDLIVGENGALIHNPATGVERLLAPAPPVEFVEFLRERAVSALSVGKVIVATQEIYRGVVLEGIEKFGLKHKVVLNKGSLMVLPHNVDKTTGLTDALRELGISRADTVGVGDAENDQAFLAFCGYSAAVGNALDFLKKQVHYVTKATHGAGVAELIEKVLEQEEQQKAA